MRKSFLFALLFFAASFCLKAQPQKTGEQAQVNQAVNNFFDGIAALDAKTMKQYTTKDFLLLEDGAVWNMDTLANKLNPLKTMNFSRTNHLDFIQTEVEGSIAWVAYNNTADMSVNGQKMNVRWLESAVLVKEGKDWKIKMLHSTPLKPKAQ
ncbi:nuclear transport factor 2 family protein [Flavisolibacter nicotianae]|uniref:nuclear transport factor 2 family protein n=1 Tax=Flavisolibacter nicotianae TaxID=2364882 RepID=UPI000EB3681B|nr:nuclear transport factor 2 family protein [Flavisolibacter nicotianae]